MTNLLHFDVCGNSLLKIVKMLCCESICNSRCTTHIGFEVDVVSNSTCLRIKPGKYGMKLFLMCDCLTGCTFNRKPYLGRQKNQRNVGLASDAVKILSSPLYFSGINITSDNLFTSSQFAVDLLQKRITLLGTIKKKRRELPCEFTTGKRRSVESSLFELLTGRLQYRMYPRKTKLQFYF